MKSSTAVAQKQTDLKSTPPPRKPFYEFVKRVFDFVASLIGSIILLIPMLIIAIVIFAKDRGNPIYAQVRVGKGGKDIKVYKFRSMKKYAEHLRKYLTYEQVQEYRKEYKLPDDPRLLGYKNKGDGAICFGAKLRKSSIDELVQILFNILILGNMSVVGPRPIIREELERYYTPEEQKLLLSVKPGLTGYWQAYARNDVMYDDGKRQEMELYYIENRSIWFDIKILFKSAGAVLKGR